MKIIEVSKKLLKEESGIYCIKNIVNGKCYIGQTINIYKRLIGHRCKLKNNKHSNDHLQKSFNKHGINNFEILVLEYCDIDSLELNEIKHINFQDECYNIRGVEVSSRGYKRKSPSDKTRQLLSNIKKGKIPKNLKDIQQKHKRKISYKTDNIELIFNSCEEAALYFKMKPNVFNQYINKNRESKYFPKNYKLEYYE